MTTESTAADGSWLGWLIDAVVSLMDVIGPVGAGIAIALENLFPPLPSEAILPMAGLAAHQGAFALWEAIVWTTLGSLVGAMALYGLGAWLGLTRLRRIVDRMPLISVGDVDRTVAWFQRHGGKAVFLGRFIPIFRSLISIPAGVLRMPLPRFALLTVAGSLIWNTVFILCGWFLGSGWHVVEQYVNVAQNVVIGAVAIAVTVFIVLRLRRPRTERTARHASASDARTGEVPLSSEL